MNIFLIISSIFFTTLAVGFFVGFFRGWCKSLIRLGITIANIAIAVFLSPFITGVITSNITEGSEISIFKFTLNLSDLFKDIIGNDITISQTTTNLLTTAIANVLANILLFLVIFLFLQVFSLMIYWIIILVLHLKCKEEKEPQNIGLRCLGGLQGLIGAIALLFVVLVPCFGIINILDKTSTNSTVPESIPQANAVSISNSFMCGELFYESEELNQIDSYINSYASLKKQYDSTLMGIILKYTGINKLGTLSFNHLTNVKVMGEKISLTNEVISVIETYNSAKTMLSDKLDYTSNNFIENVRSVYEDASQSIFIQKYLTDIIPVWAEKWSNDETFFNVSNPIPEQYHETANHMLKAIASIQSFSRLDRNINTILDSIVILNEHDFLTLLTDGQDVVSLLSNDKTIVKEILFTLSSTGELRNNLPNTLNSSLSILYDIVVGDDKFTPNISDTLFEELDWDLETDIIQNIVNEFLITYNSLSNPEVSNSEILTLLGKSIDSSRNSIILSTSLKSFIIGFIESDIIDIEISIKNNLIELINEKWDIAENPDYSFEKAFSSVSETEKVVNSILTNLNASSSDEIQDIDMSELSNIIKDIVNDDKSKNLILGIIQDEEIIDSYLGSDTVSNAIANTLSSFIENTTPETIDADLNALSSVVDIISSNKNITELDSETCNILISSIGNSTTIMNIIDSETNSSETSSLHSLVLNIGQTNLNTLSQSVEDSNLNENDKNILNKFFNI